jgi:geranylgeranyl pyrophosphate synthase
MAAGTACEQDVFTPDLLGSIESDLERRVQAAAYSPNLQSAVRHALLGGGKRLRPVLSARCAEAVGGTAHDALAAGAAVEMVHAFSLVHDDLPALDNDLMRRGRPTVHVAFGEAMAILAGDALLALAFQSASAAPRHADAVVRTVAAATAHMINGQVLDTLGGHSPETTPVQLLEAIHTQKTGALIRGACAVGAIAGGASKAQLDSICLWGETIGLMFQAVDDLLDVTQSAEHVGKAVGKDKHAGKMTYPAVLGVAATRTEIERLRSAALDSLAHLGATADPLRVLTDYLAGRTR